MERSKVSWTREHPIVDPGLGVSVNAAFSGEAIVRGAWPAAMDWLQTGLSTTAIESFQALRLSAADLPEHAGRWSSDLLARANSVLEPHGMQVVEIVRLEVHVSRESSTALSDIQAAIAKAKDETHKRVTRS